MHLQASCPHCHTKYQLDNRFAGKKVHCRHCQQPFVVDDQPAPKALRAGKARKFPLLLLWSIAGGLFLLAGAVLLVFLLVPRQLDQKLKDLQVGDRASREQAMQWLAQADRQDADRARVTAALEPMLFDGDVHRALNPDLLLRAYLYWATKDNVPALIRMVENPTISGWGPAQTGLVMDALGKLQDERAIDLLAERLPDPLLHDQAVNALKVMGPRAENTVLDYLFSTEPDTRLRASQLLTAYGTSPEKITAEALRRLQSNQTEVQCSAAFWFAENPPANETQKAEAARPLANLLDSLSPQVGGQALQALKLWATRDCLPQLLNYARRQEKMAPGNPVLIDVLAQFPDETVADAIARQLPNPTLRGRAVQALLKLGPVATQAVVRYIDYPDEAVAKDAQDICRLLNIAADRQIEQILADVADTDLSRSDAALRYLAQLRPNEASRAKVSGALNAPLLDPNPGIREDALNAVQVWGSKENTATLLKLLGDFRSGGLGRNPRLLGILASFQDPAAAPALAQGLTHAHERGVVSQALKSMGPGAEDAVIPFLESADEGARIEAARILAEIGTGKSLQPLQAAAERYFADGVFTGQAQLASQKIAARQ